MVGNDTPALKMAIDRSCGDHNEGKVKGPGRADVWQHNVGAVFISAPGASNVG